MCWEKNKLLKLSSILYKLFSDIQFSKCFFESRARRTKCFFPEFFLVSLHFDVFCAFFCIFIVYLNSLDQATQFMVIKAGKRVLVPLFPPSCSSLGKGWKSNPRSKIGTYFSNSNIYHLHLRLLCGYWENFEFEMFSNCAGKH